jgi:hypothetical protein
MIDLQKELGKNTGILYRISKKQRINRNKGQFNKTNKKY